MKVPILDQGTEGACTGFGLATVVHYLLRTRDVIRDDDEISPRMLYDMARRYDEWPGEKYSGSSARGAMKGWHKHGICSRKHWIYDRKLEKQDTKLFAKRYEDALRRPLGAYLPRQSQGPHRDARRDHRGRHSLRDVAGPRRMAERGHGRRHPVDARVSNSSAAMRSPSLPTTRKASGFKIRGPTTGARTDTRRSVSDDWLANGSDIWVARLGAPDGSCARASRCRAAWA